MVRYWMILRCFALLVVIVVAIQFSTRVAADDSRDAVREEAAVPIRASGQWTESVGHGEQQSPGGAWRADMYFKNGEVVGELTVPDNPDIGKLVVSGKVAGSRIELGFALKHVEVATFSGRLTGRKISGRYRTATGIEGLWTGQWEEKATDDR